MAQAADGVGPSETVTLRFNRKNFEFEVTEVSLLCYKMNAAGIHTTRNMIRTIAEAYPPSSKQSLQAFLCLLSFYGRFLENETTVARVLCHLLQKELSRLERRDDGAACIALAHYDPDKCMAISYDASPYGFVAFLSQENNWGREAPIAFASRKLKRAEQKQRSDGPQGTCCGLCRTVFPLVYHGPQGHFIHRLPAAPENHGLHKAGSLASVTPNGTFSPPTVIAR